MTRCLSCLPGSASDADAGRRSPRRCSPNRRVLPPCLQARGNGGTADRHRRAHGSPVLHPVALKQHRTTPSPRPVPAGTRSNGPSGQEAPPAGGLRSWRSPRWARCRPGPPLRGIRLAPLQLMTTSFEWSIPALQRPQCSPARQTVSQFLCARWSRALRSAHSSSTVTTTASGPTTR